MNLTFEVLRNLLVDESYTTVTLENIAINPRNRTVDFYFAAPDESDIPMEIVEEGQTISSSVNFSSNTPSGELGILRQRIAGSETMSPERFFNEVGVNEE